MYRKLVYSVFCTGQSPFVGLLVVHFGISYKLFSLLRVFMNSYSFRQLLMCFIVVLLMLHWNFNVNGEEEHLKLLQTLKIGIDESLRNAQFKCTYSYSEYIVDSQQEAEMSDTSKGILVLHATGTLAKSDKMTFESFKLDLSNTKRDFVYSDHITVTNSELRANYVKQHPQLSYRTLFVSERIEEDKTIPILDRSYASITCPLIIGGGRTLPNFIDLCFLMNSKYPNDTKIVVEQGKEFTIIHMNYNILNTESSFYSYTLSNLYPFPVLTNKKRKTHIHHNKLDTYEVMKAIDFVKIHDGCVLPKIINIAEGPIIFDDYGENAKGKWLIRQWKSDDLGKHEPVESDFYIQLDRKSNFGGLALEIEKTLNSNVPQYFDINKFSLYDLQTSTRLVIQTPRSDYIQLIRISVLLVSVFIIMFSCYKIWKSKKGLK